uniref:Uncharacterized protein n=1 Tax=Chaetoceros debilis TaxID=122233 RepID=A0A7S3QIP6_9STRA|mmetsp:Transcript_4832/g.7073  ORF Transcript_4832/g.7073 Transcript_4832/m.7073 type:complete len:471 (+) Transcript_4832:977-2389(+)|eukprot:CAMPEP_0194092564 /NCGR_PEP_ID=MMETSP0149-20130528/47207_1 /TAXON_ID=122233 /ORGANISM="Chaetoceros debilis, Strain MM31A-1" /LENGTH=470 /DNA_ID=CAMNT_0038777549 /DNA_START=421 /DNA_END=1833 /DNA_ORIENTATION=+
MINNHPSYQAQEGCHLRQIQLNLKATSIPMAHFPPIASSRVVTGTENALGSESRNSRDTISHCNEFAINMDFDMEKVGRQSHTHTDLPLSNLWQTGLKKNIVASCHENEKAYLRYYNNSALSDYTHWNYRYAMSNEYYRNLNGGRGAISMSMKPPSCSRRRPTMNLQQAIEQRRYDILHQQLSLTHNHHQSGVGDPNEEHLFHDESSYMTGLEYAVFTHDWRMAILLYMHAADPKYNCFDGRIVAVEYDRVEGNARQRPSLEPDPWGRNQARPHGNDSHIRRRRCRGRSTITTSRALSNAAFLHHLSKTEGHVPISGFKGLYCLLNPTLLEDHTNLVEYNKTMSSLWLMKQTYGKAKRYTNEKDIIALTRSHLNQIGAIAVWRWNFCESVYFIIKCIRRMGRITDRNCLPSDLCRGRDDISWAQRVESVPNDICLCIMEYLVDDLLSHAIEEGLKFVSESAGSMEMRCTQ